MNPEHDPVLISERLLEAWELRMADEHRGLTWSQELRREQQNLAERARIRDERKRAAAAAAKQVRLLRHRPEGALSLMLVKRCAMTGRDSVKHDAPCKACTNLLCGPAALAPSWHYQVATCRGMQDKWQQYSDWSSPDLHTDAYILHFQL